MHTDDMPPLGLFRGELAVVTGSASSIGRGIAIALAREGAEVVLVDVAAAGNDETLRAIMAAGGKASALTVDLSDAEGWKAVLAALGDRVPHMFVHSASPPRNEVDHAAAVDAQVWDAMVNTNLRSGFFIGQALAQRMSATGIAGRLLYLTSLHAETPRNLP
ncbi:MAG: SDR family oxidoreductase, partial [Microbacteriaceae bacterium]|nr:SDR family oxidoreductase [Microbacteriaceae bacterium]